MWISLWVRKVTHSDLSGMYYPPALTTACGRTGLSTVSTGRRAGIQALMVIRFPQPRPQVVHRLDAYAPMACNRVFHTRCPHSLWITSFVPTLDHVRQRSGDKSLDDYALLTGSVHSLWITPGEDVWKSCGHIRRVIERSTEREEGSGCVIPRWWTNPVEDRWIAGGQRLWKSTYPQSTTLYTGGYTQSIPRDISGLSC
jgi:hypothetical protein